MAHEVKRRVRRERMGALSPPRRWRPIVGALLVLLVYTIPLGNLPYFWNPNEMSRLMLTVSLVERNTVQLDRALSDYGSAPQDMAIRDGHAYSDKAPGLSLAAALPATFLDAALPRYDDSSAPDYWPLRHGLTWLLICLPAALLPFLAVTERYVESATNASPVHAYAALFALTTPILTYASLFFSHVLAGFLVGAAYLLVRLPRAESRSRAWIRAFAAGLLAAFAVVTEYPTIILAALVLATLVVVGRRDSSTVVAFVVGGMVGGLPLLVYNEFAWGAMFTTGYAFKASAEQAAIHGQGFFGVRLPTWDGLWGVLFSARRGLLFYCPLLLCLPLGWASMWRVNRVDAALSMAGVILYVMFAAGFVDWEGGWSAADRHLVPILPMLFVPLVAGIQTLLERTWSSAILAILAGCSLCAAILSVAVTPYFPELFKNPLADVAVRSLLDGAAMRNIISDHTSVAPLTVFIAYAALVTLAVGGSLWSLARLPNRRRVMMAAFLGTMIVYPAGLRLGSSPPTPTLEQARSDLLRRIGYEDLAQSIAAKAAHPTP